VGESLWTKVAQKLFAHVWKLRAKILHTRKNLPAPTPMYSSLDTPRFMTF